MTQAGGEASSGEPGVAIGLLRPVMRALLERGCEYRTLFAAEGLTAADLDSIGRRVPHSSVLRVLDAAVLASGDPAFGLIAAAHADLADIGLMGQLIATAPSVGDALARTCRFARLLHDAAEAWGEHHGEQYHWYMTMHGVPMTLAAAEALAGGAIARMRFRLGLEWSPREMWFQYPEPPYRDAYERFFRCTLRFGMPRGGTVFDANVLALSNGQDGAIAELMERRAESALERLSGVQRCADRVRDVLGAGLARGETSVELVARALHMSRATLTRRLAAEGTTLTEVLDGLRRDLALEYVRDPALSLEELAHRLAFSDARALRRAFQRWTGKTPNESRRKNED